MRILLELTQREKTGESTTPIFISIDEAAILKLPDLEMKHLASYLISRAWNRQYDWDDHTLRQPPEDFVKRFNSSFSNGFAGHYFSLAPGAAKAVMAPPVFSDDKSRAGWEEATARLDLIEGKAVLFGDPEIPLEDFDLLSAHFDPLGTHLETIRWNASNHTDQRLQRAMKDLVVVLLSRANVRGRLLSRTEIVDRALPLTIAIGIVDAHRFARVFQSQSDHAADIIVAEGAAAPEPLATPKKYRAGPRLDHLLSLVDEQRRRVIGIVDDIVAELDPTIRTAIDNLIILEYFPEEGFREVRQAKDLVEGLTGHQMIQAKSALANVIALRPDTIPAAVTGDNR